MCVVERIFSITIILYVVYKKETNKIKFKFTNSHGAGLPETIWSAKNVSSFALV